jgi:hypothetical protein
MALKLHTNGVGIFCLTIDTPCLTIDTPIAAFAAFVGMQPRLVPGVPTNKLKKRAIKKLPAGKNGIKTKLLQKT